MRRENTWRAQHGTACARIQHIAGRHGARQREREKKACHQAHANSLTLPAGVALPHAARLNSGPYVSGMRERDRRTTWPLGPPMSQGASHPSSKRSGYELPRSCENP